MNFQSVRSKKQEAISALLLLLLAIVFPLSVQASMPNEEAAQQAPTKSTAISSFSVARPNTDFTASAGFAFFMQQHGITVTLPPASEAEGKEILIVPSFPPNTHFWKTENGYFLKCSGGEHIIYNGCAIDRYKNWMSKVGIHQQELFISDGKNWNLLSLSGSYDIIRE